VSSSWMGVSYVQSCSAPRGFFFPLYFWGIFPLWLWWAPITSFFTRCLFLPMFPSLVFSWSAIPDRSLRSLPPYLRVVKAFVLTDFLFPVDVCCMVLLGHCSFDLHWGLLVPVRGLRVAPPFSVFQLPPLTSSCISLHSLC